VEKGIKRRQKVFMSKEMLLRIEQKKLQEAAKKIVVCKKIEIFSPIMIR
jgi:hypothetical protein